MNQGYELFLVRVEIDAALENFLEESKAEPHLITHQLVYNVPKKLAEDQWVFAEKSNFDKVPSGFTLNDAETAFTCF